MKEADPRCLLSQPPKNFASEGCERQGAPGFEATSEALNHQAAVRG